MKRLYQWLNWKKIMSKNFLTGIYPGTFDPVTFGHLDIVTRATHIVDKLIISVATNKHKSPFFSLSERIKMLQDCIDPSLIKNCEIIVVGFDNLLVDHAKNNNAQVIIRGLRAVADFEYEFQMAGMNRHLLPEVETVFLTPSEQYQFISGSIVREISILGGDVRKFVFPSVEKWLLNKLKK